VNPNLGLSHHEALDPLLARHPDSVDFLSVTTDALLAPSPWHDATLALTERHRVAVHGNFIALTASTTFDSLRARGLAKLSDQCVFQWVAERLDAPSEPVADLLEHVVERVEQLQDFLGASVLVSNGPDFHGPATPTATTLAFLSALARRTGCGLLLDLDALCDGAPPVKTSDADGSSDHEPSDSEMLIGELGALDLDAVRGLAIGGLVLDGAVHPSVHPLQDRPAALLKRLVTDCRRLRGITIGLPPANVAAIDIDGLADGLDRMRATLPRPAGVVAFPGITADRPATVAPRPRGYFPGHGRGAPMHLVDCAPEADTTPVAGAGETPPGSAG